jgi:hypothetical protein
MPQSSKNDASAMAGEFWVMSALYRRGSLPALAVGGAKAVDVLVATRGGKMVRISVKSSRGGDKWPLGKHVRSAQNLFYAFLLFNDFRNPAAAPDVWIVPSAVVMKWKKPWMRETALYYGTSWKPARLDDYKNAWHLLR